ncbi:hypothetical protein [Leptospira sarikeiensis]|uniref:Uncharacterized protein n=1 Tax=Leptospira sarikeiensis TaxID=2484943 RepID=A0A4V3JSG3_9LEPT|nr:hypothetical protein [Leptospira sarikeiensis]TGL64635.1 hypothetical protein EHQ64_01955 [Leptospira sarikeiensis]
MNNASFILTIRIFVIGILLFISNDCTVSVVRRPENFVADKEQYPHEVAILIPKAVREYNYPTNMTTAFNIGEALEQSMKLRAKTQFENAVIIDSLFQKHPDIKTIAVKINDVQYEFHPDKATGLLSYTIFQIFLTLEFYEGQTLVKTVKVDSGRVEKGVPFFLIPEYAAAESISNGITLTVDKGFEKLLSDQSVQRLINPDLNPSTYNSML